MTTFPQQFSVKGTRVLLAVKPAGHQSLGYLLFGAPCLDILKLIFVIRETYDAHTQIMVVEAFGDIHFLEHRLYLVVVLQGGMFHHHHVQRTTHILEVLIALRRNRQ